MSARVSILLGRLKRMRRDGDPLESVAAAIEAEHHSVIRGAAQRLSGKPANTAESIRVVLGWAEAQPDNPQDYMRKLLANTTPVGSGYL